MKNVLLFVNTITQADMLSRILAGVVQKGRYHEGELFNKNIIIFPLSGGILDYTLFFNQDKFKEELLPETSFKQKLKISSEKNAYQERKRQIYDTLSNLLSQKKIEKIIIGASSQDMRILGVAHALLEEFNIGCSIDFLDLTNMNQGVLLPMIKEVLYSTRCGIGNWEKLAVEQRIMDEIGYVIGTRASYVLRSKKSYLKKIDIDSVRALGILLRMEKKISDHKDERLYFVSASTDIGDFNASANDPMSLKEGNTLLSLLSGIKNLEIESITEKADTASKDIQVGDELLIGEVLEKKGVGTLDDLWARKHSVMNKLYYRGIITCPAGANYSKLPLNIYNPLRSIVLSSRYKKENTIRPDGNVKKDFFGSPTLGIDFHPCILANNSPDKEIMSSVERQVVEMIEEQISKRFIATVRSSLFSVEAVANGISFYKDSNKGDCASLVKGDTLNITALQLKEKPKYSGLSFFTKYGLCRKIMERNIARGDRVVSIISKILDSGWAKISGEYILLTNEGRIISRMVSEKSENMIFNFGENLRKGNKNPSLAIAPNLVFPIRNKIISMLVSDFESWLKDDPLKKVEEEGLDGDLGFCPNCGSTLILHENRVECAERNFYRGIEEGCVFVIWKETDNAALSYSLSEEDIKALISGEYINKKVYWKRKDFESIVPMKMICDELSVDIEMIIT